MAYENLCMYCFEDLNGETVCPHCGKDANAAVPQIQILPGTGIYHNRFLVGRALGQDSSGIVYNALDTKRGNTIRIREYLPRNCAERLNDGSVVPVAGMEDAFETGMRKLRASIENVDDPKKKHFYFEENGTAYIAQRHSAASRASAESDMEEEPRKTRAPLFIAIGALVVAAAVIVAIMMLKNNNDEVTTAALPSPSNSVAPETTWLAVQTVEPTIQATKTAAALVDPELSWFEFATANPVTTSVPVQASVNPGATYSTVKTGSAQKSVKALQERLVELGWLSSSQVTGSYDAATKQAVKDFQTYVNENCSPATKLAVDGIAGSKTQQWMYDSSVALVKPTPTPTPRVTAAPDTSKVSSGSTKKEILSVQKKLAQLGLLTSDDLDGKYGVGTRSAVRKFQKRVNSILGYDVLDESGEVDELTMAYLNYYVDEWAKMQSATATPRPASVTPTPAAQSDTIDQSSSQSKVRNLQKMLVSVGLLKSSQVDGVYGNNTVKAVKAFQEYVNTNRKSQTLKVTGVADAMTQQYLEYCIEKGISAVELTTAAATATAEATAQATAEPTVQPTSEPTAEPTAVPTAEPTAEPTAVPTAEPTEEPTAEPTEEPTAEPTQEPEVYEPDQGEGGGYQGITADSETDSIRYMQEMLSTVRLLSSDNVTGTYDASTEEAVKLFQQFVNIVEKRDAVQVTGVCDATTQQYLEYAYERAWDVGVQMGVDLNEKTDTDAGNSGDTDAGEEVMSSETITNVQSMLCIVGLMSETNGQYDETTEQAVRAAQRFINDVVGQGTVPEDGACDETTLYWLGQAAANGWNMGDLDNQQPGNFESEDDESVYVPEMTETSVAQISDFEFSVGGETVGDSVELESGKYAVSWSANGVSRYSLYLYTQDGTLVNKQENTQISGFNLDTAGMVPGSAYELRVGAIPEGGTSDDIVWRSLYITLKAQAEPDPTENEDSGEEEWKGDSGEEEWQEPVVTEAPIETEAPVVNIGTPVINIDGTAYQQGGVKYITGSSAILSWMADGDVEAYDVALIYEDGTRYALGSTTDTSKALNISQLAPGMYTVVVNANPVGGGSSTSSQLIFCVPENNNASTDADVESNDEEDSYEEPVQQTANTEVMNIQMALYRYGLLNTDNISEGVLNYDTLAAVAQFQMLVNDQLGYNLPVLDPGSATSIDLETINVLLNEKPNLSLS